ncbi:ankyrin repeat domain-containing protein [Streptomyces avermitilis]|uniref:ankyrin repeat domain-containing protein n=1 Tax=Streptomyces avermitilis TaxID=33903 RepID=UPI003711A322
MNTQEPAGLFTAVYEGDEDTVVRLLRAGTAAEARDEDGQTALYLAAVSNEPGIVRLLLAAGADPDRLSADADSPLCGAACGGHTEVVRALLAAGATADLEEEFGFRALTWAVQRGQVEIVTELLAAGAHPDRPGPTGEAPLVAAARRGSPGCVRALLAHGAGALAPALDEARRWRALDVEAELRAGLEQMYGPGHEVVTHRIPEDGGITVEVQLRTGERTVAANDQQTGHAAVVTLLEDALGIATPVPELAGRALRCGDPANDDWTEAVSVLVRRAGGETFTAATAWSRSPDPLLRALGTEVLRKLNTVTGPT